MTHTPTRPAGLKAGPLVGQDLSLLKAGSSVLRLNGDCAGYLAGALLTYAGCDGILKRRFQLFDERGQPPKTWAVSRFSYLGERGEDGWITAPEGGWESNPVPGIAVEVKIRSGDCFTGSDLTDEATWRHIWGEGDIIAFRPTPEARPSDPSTRDGTDACTRPESVAEIFAMADPFAAEAAGVEDRSKLTTRDYARAMVSLATPPASEVGEARQDVTDRIAGIVSRAVNAFASGAGVTVRTTPEDCKYTAEAIVLTADDLWPDTPAPSEEARDLIQVALTGYREGIVSMNAATDYILAALTGASSK